MLLTMLRLGRAFWTLSTTRYSKKARNWQGTGPVSERSYFFRIQGNGRSPEIELSQLLVNSPASEVYMPTFRNTLPVLGNNQLDALFHVFIYLMSLHVSSVTALIIRRSNCINTSSGMISLCTWLLGMPVRSSLLTGIPSSHLHRLIIPDDVLIQFDLLTMGAVTLQTCRNMK